MTKLKQMRPLTKLAILFAVTALLVPSGSVLVSAQKTASAPETAPEETPVPLQTEFPGVVSVSETPVPTPQVNKLSMYDFSCGSTPKPECYTEDGYTDDTISVRMWRETLDGSVYNCCDVTIADASQLRAALGGTTTHAQSVKFSKLSARNNPVVAINGDYYYNRLGSYALRQSQVLQDENTSPLDLLIIDYSGDFHIYYAADKVQAIEDMQGQMYQVYSFGPALVMDGILQLPSEEYIFDPARANPRAAIGQLGPLHYLLVVVDGRTDYSKGIDIREMAAFMKSKNCLQAYALDGGASASIYFNGEIYNHGTDKGERSMYDVLYFASAAD